MTTELPLFDADVLGAMHLFTVLTILLTACGHDELDFAPPDAGRGSAGENGARSGMQMTCAGSDSRCQDLLDAALLGDDLPQGGGGGGGAELPVADAGTGTMFDWGVDPLDRYQDDPLGYPTGPGQDAPACTQGQSFAEVCANDLDEDCDGTVDEYPGIGEPCASGCGEGTYVCSAETNALLCRGLQGCMNEIPPSCGDGFLNSGEECDPNAPSEIAGVTCTLTCDRPLFIHCVEAGLAFPERCDDLHVCNERIGACVPVIGPRQRRCPEIRIAGSSADDAFYPMLETEDGQCWVTCSESDQCPSSLSDCYMGFCVVPF